MLRLQRAMSKDFSLRSFVVACAIMFVAVALRVELDFVLPETPPFVTLYPAVVLAGLLCGPWAGGVAALLGMVTALYMWIPPRLSFGMPNLGDGVSLALFAAASGLVLWVAAILRALLDAAHVARSALELGLAAGGVGTWEIDLRTLRITASSAAYRLHGLPEGKLSTTVEDWMRGVPAEDEAAARRALEAAVVDGSTASYSYRIAGVAEGTRWISARGRVVSEGGSRRLLCALVDITEQVRVQDELQRERERLRLALEAGALAMWDFDPATGVATIDTSYTATMGFDTAAKIVTTEEIGERIHPEDLPRVASEHDALIAKGAGYRIEYRIVTKSGDIRWLVSQGNFMKSDTLSPPGRLIGIIQDITDSKRREDGLRELAAARELLVREADHRIKNSLQLVVSLLTAQLRGIEDAGAKEALRGAITRVGAISASHLALQGSADLKEVDLTLTLRELCGHLAELDPAVAITCRRDEPLMLDADRAIPLGLAISEILTNALRHAFPDRQGGKVVVEAWTEACHLIVRVTDDGVGMTARADKNGLGSTIIRSLAAQLDATIDVESTPSVGTAVTLRLPLQPRKSLERATS